MMELIEYRQKLIARFLAAAHEFRGGCLAVRDPLARPADGSWSVHQISAHTRDVDQQVYGLRVRRTLNEDNPEFPNFDGDAYMAEHYRADEPLSALLDGFIASTESLAKLLQDAPPAAWARLSRHETLGGGLTLQTWVERGLEHIEEHLKTVRSRKE